MTPREPDRFDKQARELVAKWYGPPLSRESVPWIAAALRAAESSALERAAQLCDSRAANMDGKESLEIATLQLRGAAEGIRALIPPAAAPESQRDIPCRGCGHPLWWHQWDSKEHAFCCAPLDVLQRDYCQCKNYEKPAAAPAAETGKVDARDVFGWGNDGPGSNYPATSQGPWRVGRHYQIHVYEGDRPVATFFRAEDARRAVDAQARIAELESALLDFLCSHGPPPDCAGKGECVCDAAWPLFDLPHGAVDSARRLRNRREAAQAGGGGEVDGDAIRGSDRLSR